MVVVCYLVFNELRLIHLLNRFLSASVIGYRRTLFPAKAGLYCHSRAGGNPSQ